MHHAARWRRKGPERAGTKGVTACPSSHCLKERGQVSSLEPSTAKSLDRDWVIDSLTPPGVEGAPALQHL